MRKLSILKSLVDFIWLVTCIPGALLLIFFAAYIFIEPESLNLVFDIDIAEQRNSAIAVQIFGLLFIVLAFGTIYCVYLFRKTLRYFQKVKPFHNNVIHNFHQIGYLLSGIGLLSSILFFVAQLFFKAFQSISNCFDSSTMIHPA